MAVPSSGPISLKGIINEIDDADYDKLRVAPKGNAANHEQEEDAEMEAVDTITQTDS